MIRLFFFDQQFGFREKHSTELAATYLVNKITSAMESKDLTLGIFLDLSKAFDTIDHNILLTKLHHNGIRGTAHSWFKSYLTNRKQYTAYGKCLSSPVEINWGVPQGSILGPILFLIYVNDFSKCLQSAEAIMYADDTNVFLHHKNVNTLFNKAQLELYNITKWLAANKLTLNINKTKYVCFSSSKSKNLLAYGNKRLSINSTPLEQVQNISFLGLYLDENLSWKSHMLIVIKKLRSYLGIISKLKYHLNIENLIQIYHSLIESQIRYGIMTWNHGHKTLVQKIQRLCDKFTSFVNKNKYGEPVKFLSVRDLYILSTGMFMYKLKHRQFQAFFSLCFNATSKFIILQHVIVTLIISLTFQNQLPNSLSPSVELKHGT